MPPGPPGKTLLTLYRVEGIECQRAPYGMATPVRCEKRFATGRQCCFRGARGPRSCSAERLGGIARRRLSSGFRPTLPAVATSNSDCDGRRDENNGYSLLRFRDGGNPPSAGSSTPLVRANCGVQHNGLLASPRVVCAVGRLRDRLRMRCPRRSCGTALQRQRATPHHPTPMAGRCLGRSRSRFLSATRG